MLTLLLFGVTVFLLVSLRPVSCVPCPFCCASFAFGDGGSSVSSRGSCHPAGPCRLPSRSVASIRRSVSVGQIRCGNVSTKSCDVAVASIVARLQSLRANVVNV